MIFNQYLNTSHRAPPAQMIHCGHQLPIRLPSCSPSLTTEALKVGSASTISWAAVCKASRRPLEKSCHQGQLEEAAVVACSYHSCPLLDDECGLSFSCLELLPSSEIIRLGGHLNAYLKVTKFGTIISAASSMFIMVHQRMSVDSGYTAPAIPPAIRRLSAG